MTKPTQFINFAELDKAIVSTEPYPYTIISDFINLERLSELVRSFPAITHRGSIPASSVECSPLFQEFLQEMDGEELRNKIAQKFSIDLADKPTLTTLRGYTTSRDGHIHTDSKDKLITVLIYLNETWNNDDGKLRLLTNNHSLDDYVAEVSPQAGTCLIFKVTPNGWHGHKVFTGKRLSLQFNYLTNDAALKKHTKNHSSSAKWKRLFPWLFSRSY